MGMDVYGKNPVSEAGEYFRRNVWGWHPLWEYVENMHPYIASKVEYGHSNDGDGLGADEASLLGEQLLQDVATGRAAAYVGQRDAELAAMPMEPCEWCDSTGVRSDEVGVRLGMVERQTCNGCGGKGEREPYARSYFLRVEDLVEFADFLRECGGFEIY